MSLRMYSSWVMCLSLALLTAVNGLVSDTSNIRTKAMRTVCLVYFEVGAPKSTPNAFGDLRFITTAFA